MNFKERGSIGLKGLAMGIAEVIPGVSGGTIAFITGIYERLLAAIKSFDLGAIKAIRTEGLKGFWKHIDGNFIISLIVGMGIGVVLGVKVITHILEEYPEMLWAFFFGLIIASAIYIYRQVEHWGATEYGLLVLGIAIAFGVTLITPVSGSTSYPYVFFAGMIAICALILPGVSGSFMLVLLGLYTTIIPLVKQFLETFDLAALSVLMVFGLGCIVGLLSFSRLVSYTYQNYRDKTLALLTGFMLGSLNKIWPWRNPQLAMDDSGIVNNLDLSNLPDLTEMKIIKEANVLPGGYYDEAHVLGVIICAIVGFVLVFALDRISSD